VKSLPPIRVRRDDNAENDQRRAAALKVRTVALCDGPPQMAAKDYDREQYGPPQAQNSPNEHCASGRRSLKALRRALISKSPIFNICAAHVQRDHDFACTIGCTFTQRIGSAPTAHRHLQNSCFTSHFPGVRTKVLAQLE
jgi:hypothetical protein